MKVLGSSEREMEKWRDEREEVPVHSIILSKGLY